MDLKESSATIKQRHPWEIARLKIIQRLLASLVSAGSTVLDVGCGDGYIACNLYETFHPLTIVAVDINLTDDQLTSFNNRNKSIEFRRELPERGAFDLLLLLDVLEHIENDQQFLSSLTERLLASKGLVLITVPAFQSLFSYHDRFLGHFRRYDMASLTTVVAASGLKTLSSGFLFSTLLLPKLFFFKYANSSKRAINGVGNWRGGARLTQFLTTVLEIENRIMLGMGRYGITIPGLTGWALCEKR